MDRVYFRKILTIVLIFISSNVFSKTSNEKINIFTWWGYLSEDSIEYVKKKCNTDVSVDIYYSNSEFLRRWEQDAKNYNIIIYSNTIYNSVKNKIKPITSNNLVQESYHPQVSRKLNKSYLKMGTRILTLAFSGFLWKKENITLNESLSLETMLSLAKNKLIVILDDAIEGFQILESLKYFEDNTNQNIYRSKIVIANDIEKLIKMDNFAFAYHWSGGSIELMSGSSEYDFLVHPQLSHITADLISITNNSEKATCVYNTIAGREFLTSLQRRSNYFSPYGNIDDLHNPNFKKLHKKYFEHLDKFKWLKQPPKEESQKIESLWKKIKLQFSKQ